MDVLRRGKSWAWGKQRAASRRPEKRVQAAAASSLGCGGEAGSRVPTVSTLYLPYPDFFPLFLIRKRWDTAGYVYPGVSARVPVSPRTRTAIRQFLPYPCFVGAGGHLVGRQNFEAMPKYWLAVKFLRPRAGKTLAADSLANILARQLLAGRALAGSKQPLRAKTGGTG